MKKVIVGFLLVCLTLLICTYPVQAATRAEIDAAITSGMAWLAARQNPDGSWGTSFPVGKTGFAVLKFETHAIQNCTDALNPSYQYYAQVRNGLDYIFANAHITAISPQPAGDPDTDGDGIGVYFVSFGMMLRTYETGIAMMAIAASTHPEMLVNVPSSAVNGWTYEEVLQDAVDYLAFGQNDVGLRQGGWGYLENDGSSTNSNTGYAVRGLSYAEAPTLDGKTGFACTIPAFVRSELNIWIDYIQNDVDGDTNDGGSGYMDPITWVNILKTGNLLFEMAFYGDTAATQRVQDAIDYLVRHWNDANDDPGWKGLPAGIASYQAMYTTMKGLEMLGIYDIDGIDWQADFADVLVAQQNADGSWPPCIWDYGERILATEWALLTLQGIDITAPTIFILSPENKTYSVEDVPLTFTVDEATSWMGYSLDGQANVTITGNTTLSGLLDGSHYVVVYANDTAGNMGTSNMVYFTVDTVSPSVEVLSPENKTYARGSVPLNFTFDEATSWMGYSLDGQMNVTISGNTTIVGLSDGVHTITVYANDTAGNMGYSNTVYFTVDTVFPNIEILSPENKTYAVEDVPLTFTVDEATSWMGYSLDGQANVTITGNTTLSGLLDGSHYVVVYANDTAGNMGASNTVYFTVDTTPPSITDVSQTPLEDNVLPEDEVKINATVTDELSEVKQVSLNYTAGNGTWTTVNMTNLEGNVWNATIPAFPYGTNVTYRIIAEDNMNNLITTEDLGYEYQYTVIPEFPSLIFLPLSMIATLLAVIIYKRKRSIN